MKLNQAGIDLIKRFEQCRFKAYPDPGTGGDPWTIGWGTTGPDIYEGLVWTQDQCDARFISDITQLADNLIPHINMPLNDNQFSALVSFAYNVGLGNFMGSTLRKMVNAGGFIPASKQFERWDRANGKEMQGLLNRRTAEKELFLLPIT